MHIVLIIIAWMAFCAGAVNLATEIYLNCLAHKDGCPIHSWGERFTILMRWLFMSSCMALWHYLVFLK